MDSVAHNAHNTVISSVVSNRSLSLPVVSPPLGSSPMCHCSLLSSSLLVTRASRANSLSNSRSRDPRRFLLLFLLFLLDSPKTNKPNTLKKRTNEASLFLFFLSLPYFYTFEDRRALARPSTRIARPDKNRNAFKRENRERRDSRSRFERRANGIRAILLTTATIHLSVDVSPPRLGTKNVSRVERSVGEARVVRHDRETRRTTERVTRERGC